MSHAEDVEVPPLDVAADAGQGAQSVLWNDVNLWSDDEMLDDILHRTNDTYESLHVLDV